MIDPLGTVNDFHDIVRKFKDEHNMQSVVVLALMKNGEHLGVCDAENVDKQKMIQGLEAMLSAFEHIKEATSEAYKVDEAEKNRLN